MTPLLMAAVAAITYGSRLAAMAVLPRPSGRVETVLRRYVPRDHTEGTAVSQPRNGWIAVYDELCDRDPAALPLFNQCRETYVACVRGCS